METTVSLVQMLDARERRVQHQQELLAQYHKPLICFTMNICGPVKDSPLIRRGFARGRQLLRQQFLRAKLTPLYQDAVREVTGCEAFYVLDASPAALGLAANEYVTEFMAAFGIVPANFRQVEAPRVDCKALAKLTGGTQFVNQADAGGVYNGQWIMATSRWVTRVYAPSKPLPRTGY